MHESVCSQQFSAPPLEVTDMTLKSQIAAMLDIDDNSVYLSRILLPICQNYYLLEKYVSVCKSHSCNICAPSGLEGEGVVMNISYTWFRHVSGLFPSIWDNSKHHNAGHILPGLSLKGNFKIGAKEASWDISESPFWALLAWGYQWLKEILGHYKGIISSNKLTAMNSQNTAQSSLIFKSGALNKRGVNSRSTAGRTFILLSMSGL